MYYSKTFSGVEVFSKQTDCSCKVAQKADGCLMTDACQSKTLKFYYTYSMIHLNTYCRFYLLKGLWNSLRHLQCVLWSPPDLLKRISTGKPQSKHIQQMESRGASNHQTYGQKVWECSLRSCCKCLRALMCYWSEPGLSE